MRTYTATPISPSGIAKLTNLAKPWKGIDPSWTRIRKRYASTNPITMTGPSSFFHLPSKIDHLRIDQYSYTLIFSALIVHFHPAAKNPAVTRLQAWLLLRIGYRPRWPAGSSVRPIGIARFRQAVAVDSSI